MFLIYKQTNNINKTNLNVFVQNKYKKCMSLMYYNKNIFLTAHIILVPN